MKKSDDSKKIKKEIEKALEKDVKKSNDTKKAEDIEKKVDDTVKNEKEELEQEFKNLRIELEDEELKEGQIREKIISEEDIDAKKIKMKFFKRFLISIKDFERYIEVAMVNISNSFGYLFKLVLIASIIVGTVTTVFYAKELKASPEKFHEQIAQTQQEYNLQMDQGLVDRFINDNSLGAIIGILIIPMILALVLALYVSTLLNIVVISVLGYLASRIMRIPLKYKATFNMAVSAVTLPLILNVIYTIANLITGFKINNFELMYDLIAYVYMMVAIMFIRTEIIKKNIEGEKAK